MKLRKLCAVCGMPTESGIYIHTVFVHDDCGRELQDEIDRLEEDNQIVNASHIARRLFRERTSTTKYLLREIPNSILMSAKVEAAKNEMTIRELIISLMSECGDTESKQ